ncbi:MAG TPA: hypothetical protein PKJ19_05140 [Flavobacteriales bacterium]|nr:hypothetical protein [Flavobacteriales bacterium]HNU57174.1 hypothetical protein [Flavobacteriales bacterium]
MDDRIRFETKEELNARREREFLAMTPSERLPCFLRSFNGRVQEDRPTDNFIIRKRDHGLR